MMEALDFLPWALPALLTLLIGTGALLRRRRDAWQQRAASIVIGIALGLAAIWAVSSVLMALRAIA